MNHVPPDAKEEMNFFLRNFNKKTQMSSDEAPCAESKFLFISAVLCFERLFTAQALAGASAERCRNL